MVGQLDVPIQGVVDMHYHPVHQRILVQDLVAHFDMDGDCHNLPYSVLDRHLRGINRISREEAYSLVQYVDEFKQMVRSVDLTVTPTEMALSITGGKVYVSRKGCVVSYWNSEY